MLWTEPSPSSSIRLQIPGEIASLTPVFPALTYVYVDDANQGAAVVIEDLVSRFTGVQQTKVAPFLHQTKTLTSLTRARLSVRRRNKTSARGQLRLSDGTAYVNRWLLYLVKDMWNLEGEVQSMLVKVVGKALKLGMMPILLHEQDEHVGGTDFGTIINSTPTELISAGLYDKIAIPWYPQPDEREVSARLLAKALGARLKQIGRGLTLAERNTA